MPFCPTPDEPIHKKELRIKYIKPFIELDEGIKTMKREIDLVNKICESEEF